MLEFQRFDAAKCKFPLPAVPLLPSLAWSALNFGAGDATSPSILAGENVRHFARGRYALHEAYRIAGVGGNGAVLLPSYHCRTMLDPALVLGGDIVFYPVHADLTPDLAAIRDLLAAAMGQIKALVLPHYFGIEQPAATMASVTALCDGHGITLIEDCSHAWQVAAKRAELTRTHTNRLIVASPYKFFASEDGGVLWGHPSQLGRQTTRPSLLREAKGLKAILAKASRHTTVLADPPFAMCSERGDDARESKNPLTCLYDCNLENRSSLGLSRWIMRHTRLADVIDQRRANYQQWYAGLSGIKQASALFPELPPDCAPYMFPLLIKQPDPHFFILKHAGMPIWRWDDMAVADCDVARRYRLQLLQLPCHQSLTQEQLRSMIASAAKVLA